MHNLVNTIKGLIRGVFPTSVFSVKAALYREMKVIGSVCLLVCMSQYTVHATIQYV